MSLPSWMEANTWTAPCQREITFQDILNIIYHSAEQIQRIEGFSFLSLQVNEELIADCLCFCYIYFRSAHVLLCLLRIKKKQKPIYFTCKTRTRCETTHNEPQTELQYISILANVSFLSTGMDTCLVLPLGLLNKLANKYSVGKFALDVKLISLSAVAH